MLPVSTIEGHVGDVRAVRARILNVLPAATYQMDRFFEFADIVLSDTTATACVEVAAQPRLHLNLEFVRRFCQRDEHLLMLVLHELYHVILGHTRLFPRLTAAHNIAFDAVINSMLCRQFHDSRYVDFFRRLNGAKRFPGRLLRPPKGWPDRPTLAIDATEKERSLMTLFYGPEAENVTYRDILDLLQGELPTPTRSNGEAQGGYAAGGYGEDYVLLGDHAGSDGRGAGDDVAVRDTLLTDVLRRVSEKWPINASLAAGRGDGRRAHAFLLPKPKSPRAAFLTALTKLFHRAAVLPPNPACPHGWQQATFGLDTQTVLPDWRDRHAHSRAALTNSPTLLYGTKVATSRRRWRPRRVAHVYLDISGSMSRQLPWLVGALESLQRGGLLRLFAFSTVVHDVRRESLLGNRIQNTFGTDISCVYAHFLALPRQHAPLQVVVLTDGLTGEPQTAQAAEARKRGVRLVLGLVGAGRATDLAGHAAVIERLPALDTPTWS